MDENMVEMQKISKAFPGVLALDQVDFSCLPGEVHAVVGENGAGKSTLMKILAGVYRPDEGKILLRGKETSFSSPKEAQSHGISIIYQEVNLIPELTVAENIFLGREPQKKLSFIDSPVLYQRSKELLGDLGVDIDLQARVADLGVAQQQMIEIAKALSLSADIIMMDEPSAVVSGKELESLFRIIRSLKENGKAIIYISHRIDEIFQIADRATVLKDGKRVGTVTTQDVEKPTIVRMMVGRSLSETFPARERGERKEILTLDDVCRDNVLKKVSFKVYSGEILGVAGLVGAGRTELARAIFGADPIDRGTILLNEKKIRKATPKTSISNGVGFVTENRAKDGLVHCLSVRKNLTLTILDRVKSWFFVREGKEKDYSKNCVKEFGIVAPSIEQEVQYLSGGNQQKMILAKWISIKPALLIMDEPTRGIDVGAKAEIYNLMRLLTKQGTAIIMISSELPEIIGMSDRILVMHDGRVMGELSPSEATEERILMIATGQKTGEHETKGQAFAS
ncbi:MAG: ATP-binding cassette domain-containing protein [Proteobacteria bacterium]|nr:ATP-binding cassette domain-containing protein [Pseudomonadota bacterium]NIS72546.1 ATP-binding cassette domain-containing protein [Pseudomonadota bacterium]